MRRIEPTAMTRPRLVGAAAFTLVEVVAVLVLLALLGMTGAVSMRSALRDAAANDAAAELRRQDQLLRDYALRTGRPARLEFDASRRRVRCLDGETGEPVGAAWPVPQGVDVRWIAPAARSRGQLADVAAIECSGRGRTQSYAILVEGPGPKRQRWLVSGLTGQFTVLRDETETRDVLALLPGAAGGDDAD